MCSLNVFSVTAYSFSSQQSFAEKLSDHLQFNPQWIPLPVSAMSRFQSDLESIITFCCIRGDI